MGCYAEVSLHQSEGSFGGQVIGYTHLLVEHSGGGMHLLECISSKILNYFIPEFIFYHREDAISMRPVAGPETMVRT
jgi:hypothetical protein